MNEAAVRYDALQHNVYVCVDKYRSVVVNGRKVEKVVRESAVKREESMR